MTQVPEKIIELLANAPANGEELISLTREIVDAAEDWENEDYQIFISIESQTGHIRLKPDSKRADPMPRVDISSGLKPSVLDNFEKPSMSPSSSGYEEEIEDIYSFFYADFMRARQELLAKHDTAMSSKSE